MEMETMNIYVPVTMGISAEINICFGKNCTVVENPIHANASGTYEVLSSVQSLQQTMKGLIQAVLCQTSLTLLKR